MRPRFTFPSRQRSRRRGITLIELLVAMSILVLVMLAITATMGTMQNMWVRLRGKADAFRGTRIALDIMAQRISQATLNSRWVRDPEAEGNRDRYVRESDLHYVSGPARQLLTEGNRYSGHALFFQGPFGEPNTLRPATDSALSYDQLNHTLCGWGYFVEFGSDQQDRPEFLASVQTKFPPRRRFRLWEFRQPANDLSLFEMEGSPPTPVFGSSKSMAKDALYQWFNDPLRAGTEKNRHITLVAENVLALLVTPFDPAQQEIERYHYAPDGHYDSRRFQWAGAAGTLSQKTRHRMPPALRLTVIALSEDSWLRMSDGEIESTATKLRGEISNRFELPDRLQEDLDTLTAELNKMKMGYRIVNMNLKMPEQ